MNEIHSRRELLSRCLASFVFQWLCIAALVCAFGALTASAQGGEYKLTILHTGENHGRWEPFTQTISLGGIARRATLAQRIRAEGGNTLLLDSGDVSQGTLYFIQHRMVEGAAFYNALGYDAVATGNHEFDLGPKTFAENWVANAQFAIVGTNLDFAGEPLLSGKIPAYVVKMVGGEKIGILGFTTEDVAFNSSMGPTIRVKPRVEAARTAIAALEKEGVNKIVAVSHLGYREDQKLAAAVDGIDVIAGGHTPTLLGDAAKLDRALGMPEGSYPTVIRSSGGNPVLIVHAFEFGKLLGRLNVVFDAKGVPMRWDGDPILIDNQIPDDPAVEALRQKYAAPLSAFRQTVIGRSAVDLDASARLLRTQEAAIGNLVADAMLEATKNDRTQIALMNGGGIRASIKAGDITVGNVLEVLPFANRLVQFDLTGADLLRALENGVSRVGEASGRFPQVAGLRFAYDAAKPPGARITGVEMGAPTTGFKPLDPAATYRIVTNDFMANGGDGYDALKQGSNARGGDMPIEHALMDYIRARGEVSPKVEGRIVSGVLPAAPPAPALPQSQPTPVPLPPSQATPPSAPSSGGGAIDALWIVAGVAVLAVALFFAVRSIRRRG